MKRKTVGKARKRAPIEIITRHRAADMRQMDADLVRAPGFKPKAQKSARPADALNAVVRDGGAAIRPHHAPRPVPARAMGASILPGFLCGNSIGYGEIFTLKTAFVQLRGEQAAARARGGRRTKGRLCPCQAG